MRAPLSTTIAIGAGTLTLLGFFISVEALTAVRSLLIEWAVLLAGVAGLVAIATCSASIGAK
ncbi:MAG: hypothetical protein ACYC3P_09460 [Bellilinea sp.]